MLNFKKIEEKAKKVWKKYDKQIDNSVQDDKKKKLFSFLEGPPTANAPPGLHHLEVRTFKDLICKYQFMKGNSVPRKGGWDCHGLPVEVQVEKSLGLNSKKDIEKYGSSKFIKKCKDSVFSNIGDWNISTEELAYWIDLENPYRTLDNNYIESVWWSLKELYKKKLLYEGYKVVPFCPRCGTPLSSHEVAQGYKDIKEDSVYIAFKIKNKPKEYILAWTTTPWTLPGNVALAVGKDLDYVKIKLADGDLVYLSKERLEVIRGEYEVVENIKGSNLVGIEYEPLFDIKKLQNENSHKIILGDFVTTESGTGVVHTAGMYGEDDYQVCEKENLPLVHTVNQNGEFNELVPKWEGKFVKNVENEIRSDLQERGLLYKKEKIEHTYPFCWRCDSPLLYYAIDSWFVKVSSVRNKLIKKNKEINWYPEHIKEGRFGKWLEGAKDWSLSRFKFWGTPLPIWRCECGEDKIIGSVEELKKESLKKFKEYDLHRPWIDKIKIKCNCGKEMKRIPDVIDCWYDSGSASFAQFHYPFENKKEFNRQFPYTYIAEAIDQTRGWFYTLHVLGVLLFDKPAYKNVICAGHIVDEKKEKMSKSKGNIIVPKEIIDKTGIDAVRLQFCTTDVGNSKRFSYELMRENVLPFLTVLENSYKYYSQLDGKKNTKQIEDKWILSRLNSLIKKTTENLDNFSLNLALNDIMDFVVNDFSRVYIKFTRDRNDTKEILGEILEKISLLLAPYAPYISEYIYSFFDNKSVHFSNWPKHSSLKINKELEKKFEIILKIIETGLSNRDRLQIGLKWPLKKATIKINLKLESELEEIIKRQLNVKSVNFISGNKIEVDLDSKMTPELEAEGFAREISRRVQAERKKRGLEKKDSINLKLYIGQIKDVSRHIDLIKERTGSENIKIVDKEPSNFLKFEVKNKEFSFSF
jgi:isoleucyl-tRNA synthetase